MKRQIKALLRGAELAAAVLQHGRRTHRRIFAAGDSLTAAGYPHRLSLLLGVSVANLGVGGETSSQIVRRALQIAPGSEADVLVLWAGNNNYFEPQTVFEDIMLMRRSWAGPTVVIGLVNGDFDDRRRGQPGYKQIIELNHRLATTFGPSFLDIRKVLNDAGDHNAETDVIPASLRTDQVHLTKTGDQIVAHAVFSKLRDLELAKG